MRESSLVLSAELLTTLLKKKKTEVILLLMEYSSSIRVMGEIIDPLGRLGSFIYFDRFNEP